MDERIGIAGSPDVDGDGVALVTPRFPEERKWEEYRAFVRKIPCVICQIIDNKAMGDDGDGVECLDITPELVDLSDPNHVKTWGSGGVDAENIVPLCRVPHHEEFHRMGISSFELRYNVSLKAIAKKIFDWFLDWCRETDISKVAYAEHQRIISRIDHLNMSSLELGRMLMAFRDEKIGGKNKWEILGFPSFKHYLTAPATSGGLDMSQRTAYRDIYFAEADKYSLPDAQILEIGSVKAQTILPLLKSASGDEERKEIIQTAQSLSGSDLVAWKNGRLGLPDPRQVAEDAAVEAVRLFLDSVGYEMADEDVVRMVRCVLTAVREKGGVR